MKTTALILFLIKLSCVHSIQKWEIKYKMLKVYSKWEIEFSTSENSTTCQSLPIKRRMFIADAHCVNNALTLQNSTELEIHVNHGSPYFKKNISTINRNNIYYNEDLSNNFSKDKRGISILFTDQPIFYLSDRYKVAISPEAIYGSLRLFDDEFQIFNLPDNNLDVNYTNCLVPAHIIFNIDVGPCFLFDKNLWCRSSSMLEASRNVNLTMNFVFCLTDKAQDVVVGILPEINHREYVTFGIDSYVKIQYLADLHEAFGKKYKSWRSQNRGEKLIDELNRMLDPYNYYKLDDF